MPGPMGGVQVVEIGVWVAGPAAGGVLADWGADVVKIEPPGIGDPARTFSRMLGADLPCNPIFENDNRSKRSIALDLGKPAARAIALELIAAPTCSSPTCVPPRSRGSASTTRRCSRAIRGSSTARSRATGSRAPTPTRPPTTSPATGRAPASPRCSPRRATTRRSSAAAWAITPRVNRSPAASRRRSSTASAAARASS